MLNVTTPILRKSRAGKSFIEILLLKCPGQQRKARSSAGFAAWGEDLQRMAGTTAEYCYTC